MNKINTQDISTDTPVIQNEQFLQSAAQWLSSITQTVTTSGGRVPSNPSNPTHTSNPNPSSTHPTNGSRDGQSTFNQFSHQNPYSFYGLPAGHPANPPSSLSQEEIAFVNNTIHSIWQSRDQLSGMLNTQFGRDIDKECGYPPTLSLTPDFYREIFDRDPIGRRVIELMPKECMQKMPIIYESEDGEEYTPFEEDVDNLSSTLSPQGVSYYGGGGNELLWEYLKRAVIASRIGQFGIMLLGIDDGRNLQDPTDGVEVITSNGEVLQDSPPTENERQMYEEDFKEGRLIINSSEKSSSHLTGHMESASDQRSGRSQSRGNRPGKGGNPRRGGMGNGDGTSRTTATPTIPDNYVQPADPTRPSRVTGPMGQVGTSPGNGPFVQGTDRLYEGSWGLGLPAPNRGDGGYPGDRNTPRGPNGKVRITGPGPGSGNGSPGDGPNFGNADLSGTDRFYFGIQFGPSERFQDTPSKQRNLIFLRVFDESLVQVVRYEWNIRNPRFGMPVMYRVTLNDPRQPHPGVGLPLATVYVHWSRVIHLADNLHSSEIYGYPEVLPVLNNLINIRKIYGASAEGYWKSAFSITAISTHPQLGGDVIVDPKKVDERMEALQNHLKRYMLLEGMSANLLSPTVADPTSFIEIQLEAIALCKGCPVRVLKGSERGEQASSQDDEAWNERKMEYQNNSLTPRAIIPLYDRLIQIGCVRPPSMKNKQLSSDLKDGDELTGNRYVKVKVDDFGRVHKCIMQRIPIYNTPDNAVIQDPSSPIEDEGSPHSQDQQDSKDSSKPVGEKHIQVGEISNRHGYKIEWPEIDALSKSDKATIANTRTTAMASYVAGDLKSLIAEHDFLTRIMEFSDEEASEILDNMQQRQEELQQQQMDQFGETGQMGGMEGTGSSQGGFEEEGEAGVKKPSIGGVTTPGKMPKPPSVPGNPPPPKQTGKAELADNQFYDFSL